jgi:hypothetical protein
MNAWARLACYPRGNYCPMNNCASICYRKVTKPHFRDCSTRKSHSKAILCLYTLQLVSIQPEMTLGILRYHLVRDRPSQTARQTLFWFPDKGIQSEAKPPKGSVPRSAPPKPEFRVQSLLPTLCIGRFTPMSSCSKAPGVFLSWCG